jgi:putative RNA 2'-phosphotransferase
VDLEDLVDVLVAEDILVEDGEEIVRELVESSDRRRFGLEDGRICALYGHSSRVSLEYPDETPPETLYHGSTVPAAREVGEAGVLPMGRAYVHLSSTAEEALAVGGRHTDHPVVILVDTGGAREAGVSFHQANELIWLCGSIPADCCEVPELPEEDPVETRVRDRGRGRRDREPREHSPRPSRPEAVSPATSSPEPEEKPGPGEFSPRKRKKAVRRR